MAQILLHKQRLTKKQIEHLERDGIVAIQTDDPSGFTLVNATLPQFSMDDMVWCCLDAMREDSGYDAKVARKFLINVKSIADKQKLEREAKLEGNDAD